MMGSAPGMEGGMGMGGGLRSVAGDGGPRLLPARLRSGIWVAPVRHGRASTNIKDRTTIASTSQNDVPVEIYGIIYIYNPVDEKKLGLDQQPALTGTTPPAAGSAT